MRKFAVPLVIVVLILTCVVVGGLFYLRERQPVNCNTFREENPNGGVVTTYGCDIEHDLGNGMTLKVANLRNYSFLFNKYFILNFAQEKGGKVSSHWYMAKVFEKADGISLVIKPGRSISSDPGDQYSFISIADFKKWLDMNDLKNKQVIALFYKNPG